MKTNQPEQLFAAARSAVTLSKEEKDSFRAILAQTIDRDLPKDETIYGAAKESTVRKNPFLFWKFLPALRPASVFVVALIFLALGISTVFAAQFSLPGGVLYPLKKAINDKIFRRHPSAYYTASSTLSYPLEVVSPTNTSTTVQTVSTPTAHPSSTSVVTTPIPPTPSELTISLIALQHSLQTYAATAKSAQITTVENYLSTILNVPTSQMQLFLTTTSSSEITALAANTDPVRAAILIEQDKAYIPSALLTQLEHILTLLPATRSSTNLTTTSTQ